MWDIAPECAKRVGHPAPFPVELPAVADRALHLRGRPGARPVPRLGHHAVAAARTGRRCVGYDTDPDYVEMARRRLATEVGAGGAERAPGTSGRRRASTSKREPRTRVRRRRPCRAAPGADRLPDREEEAAGAGDRGDGQLRGGRHRGAPVGGSTCPARSSRAEAASCAPTRSGRRSAGPLICTVIRTALPVVLLTSQPPKPGSEGDLAIRATRRLGATVFDVVGMLDPDGFRRLQELRRWSSRPPSGVLDHRRARGLGSATGRCHGRHAR